MQAYRGQGAHMFRPLCADWVAGNVQLLLFLPATLILFTSSSSLGRWADRLLGEGCLLTMAAAGGGGSCLLYRSARGVCVVVWCRVTSPCLADYQAHPNVAAVHTVAFWLCLGRRVNARQLIVVFYVFLLHLPTAFARGHTSSYSG